MICFKTTNLQSDENQNEHLLRINKSKVHKSSVAEHTNKWSFLDYHYEIHDEVHYVHERAAVDQHGH